jgi:hypothetical protein
MARTAAAMWWGRKRYFERRHAWGLKAPGGRPPRIPGWLRREVVEEAGKEIAGRNLETILTADPPFEEMSDAEELAYLERLDTALLLDLLHRVDDKNRNRSAIFLAWGASQVRKLRVERASCAHDGRRQEVERCAPLGVARGMVTDFTELAKGKMPGGARQRMCENQVIQ